MSLMISALSALVAFMNIAACETISVADERAIRETRGFQSDSHFHFTISPNDRWLVYFQQLTPEEIGSRDNQYGNLRILDLSNGELHRVTLAEGQAPDYVDHGDASWSPDSSHCVLPSPLQAEADPVQGILIDLSDPANLQVRTTRVTFRPKPVLEVAGESLKVLDHYGCSDCSPHLHDVELMRNHVDSKHLHMRGRAIYPNPFAEQIVSPDGTKIYYQTGRGTGEVALMQLDIATKTERELTIHKGDCIMIARMRPSPDGTKLAYQVTTGCGFISRPDVFVIDVATRDREHIAEASGGTMHWTSTGDRLFFYRDDYLHVTKFDAPKAEADPSSRIPTAPTTQPAASQPSTP